MQPRLILEKTAHTPAQLETPAAPQFALVGRSNVGKSSLLNCLAGQTKGLAKVSSTPGKTRSVNFYRVEPAGIYLVDLPGYGYAQRSKSERAAWAALVNRYMSSTPLLKGVVALLDCRLPPQTLDLELTSYVRGAGLTLIPVLTKADKCTQAERASRQREWQDILTGLEAPLLFSSKTGLGKDKLWRRLLETS